MTENDRMARLESGRLKRQADTLRVMIRMYCKARHRHEDGGPSLCAECEELTRYALKRLACCPFGQEKPTCDHCKIHCFKPEYKERIRKAMAYAGPRLMFTHPLMALDHLWIYLTVTPPAKPRNRTVRLDSVQSDKEIP
ncbi:MAG: nitrous oxide-stimulated promoter family protein [Duodenibacillus sp.]|nr:nitrous oxide-stimulated promoter family protein [Duodenibacillus sp.]